MNIESVELEAIKNFSDCQKQAWQALHTSYNVFLTGAAGTGKSFVIQHYLANKNTKQYPVVASTGAAAILINGRTFHSFFGLGVLQGTWQEIVESALRNPQVKRRIMQAHCLIIDEISMLAGETLAIANNIAKEARCSDEPWGGLRIIAVGDFAQLPPVTGYNQSIDWAFLHPIWNESQFTTINLHTVVRTQEAKLLHVLNTVRTGLITDEVRAFFAERSYLSEVEFEGTRLFAHRKSADTYNQKRLQQLDAQLHEFTTQFTGDSISIERLKKNLPIPELLQLKCNALVMIRKNDTKFPYKYINGTLATVREIGNDYVLLQLISGKTVELEKQKFILFDGAGNERASALNFPISLAWATTIHKAQGATIDRIMVDLSQLWESGHAYVALSRVPTAAGLYIDRWNESSIKADSAVQYFYATL